MFCGKELAVIIKYGKWVVFRAGLYAVERREFVCLFVCVCVRARQDSNAESVMFQSVSWSPYTIVSILSIHSEFMFLAQKTPNRPKC